MAQEPFIQSEEQQEWQEVHAFMNRFFHHYYVDRDSSAVLAMASDTMLCVGLAADEVALDLGEFGAFVKKQMERVSHALQYRICSFSQKPSGPHCWSCLYQVEIIVHAGDSCKVTYNMRLTASLHKGPTGWLFDLMHVSEANTPLRSSGSLPTYSGERRKLDQMLCQLFPGSVLFNSFESGFPVSLANQQFLHMTGYPSFRDFQKATDSLFINSILPEDQGVYHYTANFALSTGKQCECDYRLKKQDGSTLWVHDVGLKLLSENNQPTMVHVLVDVSDQMATQQKLEFENGIDPLTGVFNRKGAQSQMGNREALLGSWLFCVTDLDNFKQVNDHYGHIRGDEILCYIGQQLQNHFGDRGVVFRLGGDEFGWLLPECPDIQRVSSEISQLSREYAEHLRDQCPSAHSTMSVGGVYGQGWADPQELYAQSDSNLYRVKNSGKGCLLLTPLKLES